VKLINYSRELGFICNDLPKSIGLKQLMWTDVTQTVKKSLAKSQKNRN